MWSQRWRPVFLSVIAVVAIWLIAMTAYLIAKNSKMTAEKVKAYAESVDLSKLSGDARARALKHLADMINALSAEERRKARMNRLMMSWFGEMTEEEKAQFIDATMPTGFKQMIASFEQMPEDQRRKTVDDAMRRLKEAEDKIPPDQRGGGRNGTNALSPELQARIRSIGLQTFYSQSSAQTRAQLAPLLEEMQRVMESGRPFRTR